MPRDGTLPNQAPQSPSRDDWLANQRNALSARLMDMEIELLLLRARNAELEQQLAARATATVEPQ